MSLDGVPIEQRYNSLLQSFGLITSVTLALKESGASDTDSLDLTLWFLASTMGQHLSPQEMQDLYAKTTDSANAIVIALSECGPDDDAYARVVEIMKLRDLMG